MNDMEMESTQISLHYHEIVEKACSIVYITVPSLMYCVWTLDKMNGFWGRKRENGKTRKRDRERNWTLSRSQQWQIGSITRYFERNRFLLKPPNNYPASCLRHQKTAES